MLLFGAACNTLPAGIPSQIETRPDGHTPAVFEEKPKISLLASPSSVFEPLTFDALPEPDIFRKAEPATPTPSPYTDRLNDLEPITDLSPLTIAVLPEPALPEPELLPVIAEEYEEETVGAPDSVDATVVNIAGENAGLGKGTRDEAVPLPAVIEGNPSVADKVPEAGTAVEVPTAGARPAQEKPVLEQSINRQSYARALYARVKETVPLTFEGRGWIFTGTAGDKSGVELVSRKITANETVFEFGAAAPGEYLLNFQFQNNFTGSISFEEVALRIDELNREIAPVSGPQQTDAGDNTDIVTSAVAPPATLAGAIEDPIAALPVLDSILQSLSYSDESELDQISVWYGEAGYTREYVKCLEKYLELFPRRPGNDSRYFDLGRIFETEEFRNEKKARYYYALIVESYPASLYYSDAVGRVRYLDRHFLDLR